MAFYNSPSVIHPSDWEIADKFYGELKDLFEPVNLPITQQVLERLNEALGKYPKNRFTKCFRGPYVFDKVDILFAQHDMEKFMKEYRREVYERIQKREGLWRN